MTTEPIIPIVLEPIPRSPQQTAQDIKENATTEDKIAFADAATLGEDWVG
jgi:hypothetical protein